MLKLLGAHLAVRGCPPTPADIRDLASMLSAEPSDARRAHHPRTRI